MNRRDAIKGLATLGTIFVLPFTSQFSIGRKPLHFIGLGDAGSKIIKMIYHKWAKGKYTCIGNSQNHNLPAEINEVEFLVNKPSWKDSINGMEIKTEINQHLYDYFKEDSMYILFSGLGGYTGSCLTEGITRFLHDTNRDYITIVSIPFEFEGEINKTRSQQIIKRFEHIERFNYFKLDSLGDRYSNRPIRELFCMANEHLYTIFLDNIET